MAVSKLFTMSYIDIDTTDDTSFNITQLNSWSAAPGLQNLLLRGAGEVDNTMAAILAAKPVLSFSSPQLNTLLTNIGISGMVVDSDVDDPGLVAFLKQMDEGGTRKASTDHISVTVNEGMILPRAITASQDAGPAVMAADVMITYDGTNSPMVIAASQSIGVVPAASEAYVLGPVTINGTQVDGVQSATVSFGLTAIVRAGDGDEFPTWVGIATRDPRITIMADETDYWATLGLTGVAQGATDSVVYFRKVAADGTRVAAGTSEHISVTIDEGIIQPADMAFAPNVSAPVAFDIIPTYDGTNAVMVFSLTSTHP